MRVLVELINLLWATLREISDESAYTRHLAAHRLQASPEEWRRFWEERLRQKYSRAKCC